MVLRHRQKLLTKVGASGLQRTETSAAVESAEYLYCPPGAVASATPVLSDPSIQCQVYLGGGAFGKAFRFSSLNATAENGQPRNVALKFVSSAPSGDGNSIATTVENVLLAEISGLAILWANGGGRPSPYATNLVSYPYELSLGTSLPSQISSGNLMNQRLGRQTLATENQIDHFGAPASSSQIRVLESEIGGADLSRVLMHEPAD